ncbi:peptide chain release factor H [uncultured Erythrobacter sp.]|uniref:peptide chain release factor H n=1 Tax=uncultured Erythrobacter sp. TaxID=263913 RepID=UPI002639CAF3|nr:peptide chain release factor H [uncultured Erythrobacter sp.]
MTDIVLHLSSGSGPKECEWVIARLAEQFVKEAAREAVKCDLIERDSSTAGSLLMSVSGNGADAFAAARVGSIRWIGTSPFRPRHKRKNWYVGVRSVSATNQAHELKDADIKYQAIRASGPGGQHVNKTDSAVRATHVPSGLTTVSQDQRSQFANKKIARLRLSLLFEEMREEAKAQAKGSMWQRNRKLERGNEVRCYEGVKFRLKR